jgi:hypothetical protein
MGRQEAPVTVIRPEVPVRPSPPLGRQALTRLHEGSPGDSAKDFVTGLPGHTAPTQTPWMLMAWQVWHGEGELVINSWLDGVAIKPLHVGQELVRKKRPQ